MGIYVPTFVFLPLGTGPAQCYLRWILEAVQGLSPSFRADRGMSATVPTDPWIYHITHIDNLSGILQEGGLWCDSQRIRRGLSTTNIGYSHIKQRRLQRPVGVAAGGFLGDYVPFNFCSRSVMLYVVDRGHQDYPGGQLPIVHLVSRASIAAGGGRSWAFTDIHAELGYARYFSDSGYLSQVDWSVMPMRYWSSVSEKRQAEFLVHNFFPWDCVVQVGVINSHIASLVAPIIAQGAHRPPVVVERSWYY